MQYLTDYKFVDDQPLFAQLLARMRQGDEVARNDLVERHLGLGVRIALSFHKRVKKWKLYKDSLISEASYLVFAAVMAAKDISHDNVTAYIVTTVRFGIQKHVFKDCVIKIPNNAEVPKVSSIYSSTGELIDIPAETDKVETFFDKLKTCIVSNLDLDIMKGKMIGLADHEIADKLNVPLYLIIKARRNLYNRFKYMED